MKKLFFSLILLIGIINIVNPGLDRNVKALTPKGVSTIILDEITVTDTRLERPPTIPFIADYIFDKQLYVESRHTHFVRNSNGELVLIRSKAGAVGIAQFLPSTWEWLKKRNVLPEDFSIYNERHQRIAQRLFMATLANKNYGIKYNRVKLALAAYNAGSGRVTRLIKKYGKHWENYLPKETKRYIKIITT